LDQVLVVVLSQPLWRRNLFYPMRRPSPARPRSAQGKRAPSTDAAAASRDRRDHAAPVAGLPLGPGRPAGQPRPRSAQARRPVSPARRPVQTAGEKALVTLQEQCLDLKRTTNNLNEENTKTRTRLRVLERELQRRERLLRQLAMMKKAGQAIDMDLIEKLREERNMLPIVRRKVQELEAQVEEKEKDIRELKRDPQFTRIIELQVEYATWQHEAKRLDSLMKEADPERNAVAGQEVEVHERRVGRLEVGLSEAGDRITKVSADVTDMEDNHTDALQKYKEKEEELQREQELTRELAIAFKKVLQERKQVESMQDEIDEMTLAKSRYEEELQCAAAQATPNTAPQEASASLGRHSVSQAARSGPLPASGTPVASLLSTLQRAAASRSGDRSLFRELLQRDTDSDGLLSVDELGQAVAAVGLDGWSREDLTALAGLAPATAQPGGAPSERLRWLDLLVILDRSAAAASPPSPLPVVQPLRAACLRLELCVEEFQRRLCAVTTRGQAEAFFIGLGLDSSVTAAWVAAWEALGSDGLLLRLPIGNIGINQADFDAWFERCVDAVRQHKKDLVDSLRVWRNDMLLEQEQFNMVCLDVLGLQLSPNDISDLALFVSGAGGGPIDGGALLRIDELRQAGAR